MEAKLRATLRNGKFDQVPPVRTKVMSAVRSRGNRSTELAFRLALVRAGVKGWKLHASGLTGCPDFCFPSERTVVFIDGCFWHGCPKCHHSSIRTRSGYWTEKIKLNRARDLRVTRSLRSHGWRVIRVWEHELGQSPPPVIGRITRAFRSGPHATFRV